jgi:hypothetical protein
MSSSCVGLHVKVGRPLRLSNGVSDAQSIIRYEPLPFVGIYSRHCITTSTPKVLTQIVTSATRRWKDFEAWAQCAALSGGRINWQC